jgi:transposase
MTNGRVEVITSVQRRRRWSVAEKQQIVASSLERGAVASAVAREAGIHVSQLFRWRRELCHRDEAPAATFAAVAVSADPVLAPALPALPGGITGAVDAATISAAIAALAQGERRRDPVSGRRTGMAGDRPHRHAQRLRRPGPDGSGEAEAGSPFMSRARLCGGGGVTTARAGRAAIPPPHNNQMLANNLRTESSGRKRGLRSPETPAFSSPRRIISTSAAA